MDFNYVGWQDDFNVLVFFALGWLAYRFGEPLCYDWLLDESEMTEFRKVANATSKGGVEILTHIYLCGFWFRGDISFATDFGLLWHIWILHCYGDPMPWCEFVSTDYGLFWRSMSFVF